MSRAIEATVAPFLPSFLISSILSTPLRPLADSGSRAHPQARGELPRVAAPRNTLSSAFDMNGDLARERAPRARRQDLGTGSALQLEMVLHESDGCHKETTVSPAALQRQRGSRVAASTHRAAPAAQRASQSPPGRLALASQPEVGSGVGETPPRIEEHELLRRRPRTTRCQRQPPGRIARQPQLQGSDPLSQSARRPTRAGTRRATSPPAARRPVTSKAPIATATSREALAGPAE